MSMNCIVCSKEAAAYRCPRCREKYCSKGCCQIHKESGCGAKIGSTPSTVDTKPVAKVSTQDPSVDDKLLGASTCTSEPQSVPPISVEDSESKGSTKESIDSFESAEDIVLLNEGQKRKLLEEPQLRKLMQNKRFRQDLATIDSAGDSRARSRALLQLRQKNGDFEAAVEVILSTLSS